MFFSRTSLISFVLASASLTSLPALADAGNAQNLVNGILHAKATVDRAIRATGNNPSIGGGVGGGIPGNPGSGGPGPWRTIDVQNIEEAANSEVNEADALALPILMQASSSLASAASNADQAKLNYLSSNFAFANYKYSIACSQMGISRSQVARANTAALQPPAGFLAAFGPDLFNVVSELGQLRISEGCP